MTVIDSRSVTLGLGAIVASCARLAADGATHDEVVAHAHDLAGRTHVWGALDTLDNLKKGGRIGGAKALLASALAIKPIIEVRDGKVEQGGKQRTRSKALAFLVEKVAAVDGLDSLFVLQADCRDVDQFVDDAASTRRRRDRRRRHRTGRRFTRRTRHHRRCVLHPQLTRRRSPLSYCPVSPALRH